MPPLSPTTIMTIIMCLRFPFSWKLQEKFRRAGIRNSMQDLECQSISSHNFVSSTSIPVPRLKCKMTCPENMWANTMLARIFRQLFIPHELQGSFWGTCKQCKKKMLRFRYWLQHWSFWSQCSWSSIANHAEMEDNNCWTDKTREVQHPPIGENNLELTRNSPDQPITFLNVQIVSLHLLSLMTN